MKGYPAQNERDRFYPAESTTKPEDLIIGDVVYVNGEGDWRGKVCYLGEVDFAKGEWAGVALDHPMGNHDGMARGKRYFQCQAGHGIFTRLKRLNKKMLIPETMDAEKLGLFKERETPSPTFFRESSPAFSNNSNNSYQRSISRESSPTPRLLNRSVTFGETYSSREGSQSPVPSHKPVKVGERVIVASSVGDAKTGVLRFVGEVDFADGLWAGIELSYPLGKNDGTVRGREYFRCEHPFGLFVPLHKIESSPANKTLGKKMGTRENLYAVMSATRGVRAGSYEDYF